MMSFRASRHRHSEPQARNLPRPADSSLAMLALNDRVSATPRPCIHRRLSFRASRRRHSEPPLPLSFRAALAVVIPSRRRGIFPLVPVCAQILPVGIGCLDQTYLLRPRLTLDLLLPGDGGADITRRLIVDKERDVVPTGESLDRPMLVLLHAALQVIGNASVQRSRLGISHDIDVELLHPSSPRCCCRYPCPRPGLVGIGTGRLILLVHQPSCRAIGDPSLRSG